MNKILESTPYFYYIGKIHKSYIEYINKSLKEINVSSGDIPYLFLLIEEDHIPQEAIAKKLRYNQATVTRAVNRLEKKGIC